MQYIRLYIFLYIYQSVTSRSREFCTFLDGTGTGTGKNWSRKKVPVTVPEKFGPGKKYRYRFRKNLVPEKSTGTGTGENWSRYRRIPGNSRSVYIFISSCTFRHWEKEMSLLWKPSPKGRCPKKKRENVGILKKQGG